MGQRRKNDSTSIRGREIAFLSSCCRGDGQSWRKAQDGLAALERRCSCCKRCAESCLLVCSLPLDRAWVAAASSSGSPFPAALLSCLPRAPAHSVLSVSAGIIRLGGAVGTAGFSSLSGHAGVSVRLPSCIRASRQPSSRKGLTTHRYFFDLNVPFWPECLMGKEISQVQE